MNTELKVPATLKEFPARFMTWTLQPTFFLELTREKACFSHSNLPEVPCRLPC